MEKKSEESVARISAVATRTVELLRSVAEVMAQLRRFAQQLGVEGAESLPALGVVDALAEKVLTTVNGLRSAVSETAETLGQRIDELESGLSGKVETAEQELTASIDATNTRLDGAMKSCELLRDADKDHVMLRSYCRTMGGNGFPSRIVTVYAATKDKAGVMSAEQFLKLKAAASADDVVAAKKEMVGLIESVSPGCLLPDHAELLTLLSPQTLSENYPDVVAIVEPKEAWFAFGVNKNSDHTPVDVLVKVEDGILRRSQLPEGKDGIYLYKMDEVKYLNLDGFTRVGGKIYPLTDEQQANWPTAEGPKIIDGFVNMEGITTMTAAFNYNGFLEARGDWSGLNVKCTAFRGLFGYWAPTMSVRVVPEKLGTAKATTLDNIFGATSKVGQYPELDFASLVNYKQNPFTAWQFAGDPVPGYYPGEVRARVRNFGAQPTAYDTCCFNLLKNWNIDDVMYTLDEAAVYREKNIGAWLHGHVIERLTDAQKARISAKNITIIRMDVYYG